MADIIIKDSSGAPHTYKGVESVSYPDVLGGIAKFVQNPEIVFAYDSVYVTPDGGRLAIPHGLGVVPDIVVVSTGVPKNYSKVVYCGWFGLKSTLFPANFSATPIGTVYRDWGIEQESSGDVMYCAETHIILPVTNPAEAGVTGYHWKAWTGVRAKE